MNEIKPYAYHISIYLTVKTQKQIEYLIAKIKDSRSSVIAQAIEQYFLNEKDKEK